MERERKIMKNVPGWRAGENVYYGSQYVSMMLWLTVDSCYLNMQWSHLTPKNQRSRNLETGSGRDRRKKRRHIDHSIYKKYNYRFKNISKQPMHQPKTASETKHEGYIFHQTSTLLGTLSSNSTIPQYHYRPSPPILLVYMHLWFSNSVPQMSNATIATLVQHDTIPIAPRTQ